MAVKNNIPATKTRPRRFSIWWLVIIGVIFAQLLGYTWVRTRTTHDMINISQVQAALMKHTGYQKALLLEIDRLKAEDRIIQIARTRLNLSSDTSANTLYFPGEAD